MLDIISYIWCKSDGHAELLLLSYSFSLTPIAVVDNNALLQPCRNNSYHDIFFFIDLLSCWFELDLLILPCYDANHDDSATFLSLIKVIYYTNILLAINWCMALWDKVFKKGLNRFCGRQPLKMSRDMACLSRPKFT